MTSYDLQKLTCKSALDMVNLALESYPTLFMVAKVIYIKFSDPRGLSSMGYLWRYPSLVSNMREYGSLPIVRGFQLVISMICTGGSWQDEWRMLGFGGVGCIQGLAYSYGRLFRVGFPPGLS